MLGRSEGYARTGYWIPGCDGKGGWMRPGDSSAAAAVVVAVVALLVLCVYKTNKTKQLYCVIRK